MLTELDYQDAIEEPVPNRAQKLWEENKEGKA